MERISPEKLGLNAAQLTRIKPILQGFIDKGVINGISAMLLRHGKVAYESYLGMANAEAGLVMQPNIIYRIYSMSKPITVVALLMLYEQGLFGIDDPISGYIPSFADAKVLLPSEHESVCTRPARTQMTIRHLLTHTSGICYGDTSPQIEALYRKHLNIRDFVASAQTTQELMSTIGTLPLAFDPGTGWQYGMSIDVLGALIEVLTGKRFGQFLQKELFEPLGMNDTFFRLPREKLGRMSACDRVGEDGKATLIDPGSETAWLQPSRFESGGGGMLSSMEDYARFCQMLLNGGSLDGQRILGRATVNWMASDQLTVQQRQAFDTEDHKGYGFGLGVRVMERPAAAQFPSGIGEYGWGGAASTWYAIDPAEDMVLLLMPQLMMNDRYPFRDRYAAAAYGALEK